MGSEFSEDLWVMENVKLQKYGFYVDIGCGWPELNSNSAFLRKCGWSGICVDANPRYAPEWKGIELFRCCVIGSGEDTPFHYDGVPELSRFGDGEKVPTVRLYELLENIEEIDFLTIDTEGSEFDILSQFDWATYLPKVVVAEYSTHGIGEDFRVRDMLLEIGYRAAHQTKANIIYVSP